MRSISDLTARAWAIFCALVAATAGVAGMKSATAMSSARYVLARVLSSFSPWEPGHNTDEFYHAEVMSVEHGAYRVEQEHGGALVFELIAGVFGIEFDDDLATGTRHGFNGREQA